MYNKDIWHGTKLMQYNFSLQQQNVTNVSLWYFKVKGQGQIKVMIYVTVKLLLILFPDMKQTFPINVYYTLNKRSDFNDLVLNNTTFQPYWPSSGMKRKLLMKTFK